MSGTKQPPFKAFLDDLAVTTTSVLGDGFSTAWKSSSQGTNFIPAKSRSKVQNYRFHKEKVLFVLSRAWARSLTVVSGAQQLDHHQGSLRLGYWIAWQVQQVDLPAWCLNPGTLASAGI